MVVLVECGVCLNIDLLEHSYEGVQQGDPLGPFFFALISKRVWANVASRCKDTAIIAAYADNGFAIIPNKVNCPGVLESFIKELSEVGIQVDLCQTDVFSHGGIPTSLAAALPPSVNICTTGVKVLGAFIGSDSFIHRSSLAKCDKVSKEVFPNLPRLRNPQNGALLLRFCLVPRFDYICRCTFPLVGQDAYRLADSTTLSSFATLTGISLAETPVGSAAERQIRLPDRLSGYGIRSMVDICDIAFVACAVSSIRLVRDRFGSSSSAGPPSAMQLCFQAFCDRFLDSSSSFPSHLAFQRSIRAIDSIAPDALSESLKFNSSAIAAGASLPASFLGTASAARANVNGFPDRVSYGVQSMQKLISDKVADARFASLVASLSPIDQARVMSLSSPPSGCWKSAIPCSPHATVPPALYGIIVRQDLGLPQPLLTGIDTCPIRSKNSITGVRDGDACGCALSPAGSLHLSICNRLLQRHHMIANKTLRAMAATCGVTRIFSEKETSSFLVLAPPVAAPGPLLPRPPPPPPRPPPLPSQTTLVLNFDGGTRSGNPGVAGGAGVVLSTPSGRVLLCASAGINLNKCTNNYAEHLSLMLGLFLAASPVVAIAASILPPRLPWRF